MIAQLRGTVVEKGLNDAVLDVHGVGYRVAFSLLTLSRLPDEQPVQVRVRTVVREDAFELYGFLGRDEEEMFLALTGVSHVGPKLALSVLSGIEVQDLARALAEGNVARLTRIRGVGKKTAERLVLELKDKARLLSAGAAPAPLAPSAGVRADVVSSLVNLGFRGPPAEQAADAALAKLGQAAVFEAAFREALRGLRSA